MNGLPVLEGWIAVSSAGVVVSAVLVWWALKTEQRRKRRRWNGGLSILTGGHVWQFSLFLLAFLFNLAAAALVELVAASPERATLVVALLFLGNLTFLSVAVHKWDTWRRAGRYEGATDTAALAVVERKPELGRRNYDKPKETA